MSSKTWWARSRGWIAIFAILPGILLVLSSVPHFGGGSIGEIVCNVTAIALFGTGAFWRWWATLYIGGRKGHELMTTGPYSMSRNPLYFGTYLITLTIPVFAQSISLAIVITLVAAFYLKITVPGEELRLLRRHRERFTTYRASVPMFVPNPRLYRSPELLQVLVPGLRAEFYRSLRWISVPILCQIFLGLRMQPWWPHYFALP